MSYHPLQSWMQPQQQVSNQIANAGNIVPGMDWQPNMPNMSNGLPDVAGGQGPGFMDGMLGYTEADGTQQPGWGKMGLSAAEGLFKGWLGLKQLDMAKKELSENKRQFNMNWGAQKKATNNQIYNNQVVRNGSANPANNQDMGAYMAKWGIE